MKLNNLIILTGHLGMDPESKDINGQPYCKFSLATSEKYKSKSGDIVESTTWHNIVCWGKVAEIFTKHLNKGDQVMVLGKVVNRSYEDSNGDKKYISEVYVSEVMFLTPKK